jgi:hypothetical protein
MSQLSEELPASLQLRELQPLAQALLRSHGVELFDDLRTEVEVAIDLGYLSLHNESGQRLILDQSGV